MKPQTSMKDEEARVGGLVPSLVFSEAEKPGCYETGQAW
jgi:hypothetical protein